ncbi:ecotin putative (ISP3) [Leptomonas pyrrhocoris]|uniref:Ecotin putative (ISP3) n=1 Tax=Leptomonas pyrrhocoris TaxID=157538 RepID=A0A0M9FPB3_LEPPY|nr:ecotin putative (ISP3) [Leptomonas pyrrhocoris]XP_015651754.1 ecotin putative (ISP3) [Leptomonas pyrrhocoris]KPA73314.1 ecotin putative (ISP3) [Leptomonas pyrrhocoris]KPA73315.1 ecotin putative (ISP3) [Leptomonas pyrrhocoris]|eukprot:XP_015651753.1 ecotin putative (ISP3) [Leptomonas pyrrhocoris]
MPTRTFEYVFQQVMWMLAAAAQLIASMGVGLKWVFMTLRCITFALMDIGYFLPHVFWYLLSPNIIRRVSYRSSRTTKLRNMEALLTRQVVQESAAPPTPAASSSGKERRKSASGRDASPPPAVPDGPYGMDYDAVERFARTINPADGTFVNGLPVDVSDDANNASSFFPAALNSKNSFDDTLATLQRIYRHRSQQKQQQQQQPSKSGSQETSYRNGNHQNSDSPMMDQPPSPYAESFTDSDNDDDDVEDRMNLHNRATLDIYLPIPLDSLFRFMDQERRSTEAHEHAHPSSPSAAKDEKSGDQSKRADGKKDRSRRKSKLTRKKFPIIISVTGGAWIVGCYLWNFLMARLFAARGYVVFCPDYRNFPQTTMEGMTLDVSDAIAWVLNNADRYNGDLSNVTLIGQSAGAHLTMMSLLSQAQLCAYNYNQEHSLYENVPPPSDVAYNVPRYNPRESIHRYVGLSGIFNVGGLVRHFDHRGLYRNVLHQIAGGKTNMPRYTLNAYFDDRHHCANTGEVLPDNLFDFFPQRMFFVHGDADKSAPVTESANIVYLMRGAQRDAIVRRISENPEAAKTLPKPVTIEYILVPGATHTDSIIEEPLSGNSHIVEFLCYYDIDDDQRRHAQLTGKSPGSATLDSHPHSRSSSVYIGSTGSAEVPKMIESDALQLDMSPVLSNLSKSAQHQFPVLPATRPDGILLSPCPSSSRRKLMRLASYICPF